MSKEEIDEHANFNPRTHRGVRHCLNPLTVLIELFQSTHPSWGATFNLHNHFGGMRNFNPRTHRGVRPSVG